MTSIPFIPETENIYLLRHRFARAIEIWIAYNVFLTRQVEVGKDKICIDPFVVQQTTHTLLITYYSYLYSLFDRKGTNFIIATEEIIEHLSERAREVRNKIIEHWKIIEEPIIKIRHNIGFHGGKQLKSHDKGYSSYNDAQLHPMSADYILQLMRVFFREIDTVVIKSEKYYFQVSEEDTDKIYQYALKLKDIIDSKPLDQMLTNMINYLKNVSAK